MLTVSIEHPDSEDFIDAKIDGTKVTGANVSLKMTDSFMEAVKNGGEFNQRFPIGSEQPILEKSIDANRLWDKMMHNSWKHAEPSILFWDTIINESIPDCYADLGFKTISTNPCVVGDSVVKTNKGDLTVLDIVERFSDGEQFEILSYNIDGCEYELKPLHNAILTKKNAKVLEIKTGSGDVIRVTPNHLVFTEEDCWVEAKDLTDKHSIIVYCNELEGGEFGCAINTNVMSIIEFGSEDVYDLTVEDNHNLLINNVLVHNCGEITLCKSDSCRLLAINLYSFVDNPFTAESEFNFDKFKKYVVLAERLMDDIVELELEKIDKILEKIKSDPESEKIKRTELELWQEIKDKCQRGRRTGLGITAAGDMLAALGIQYGTKEATEFSTKVHKTLALAAYSSSVTMAMERGAFEMYDHRREEDNPMIQRIKAADPDLYDDMINHGRRNIALFLMRSVSS